MIESSETAGSYLLEIFSALDVAGASEVEVKITRHPTLLPTPRPESFEFLVSGRIGNRGFKVCNVKTLEEFTAGLDSTKHSFATLHHHLSQFLKHNKEIKND